MLSVVRLGELRSRSFIPQVPWA